MTLILQIAAGIVLAVVILAFWRGIFGIALALGLLALVLLGLGLSIGGLFWLGSHKPEIENAVATWVDSNTTMAVGFLLTGVAVFLVWLVAQLMKKPGAVGPNTGDPDKIGKHH